MTVSNADLRAAFAAAGDWQAASTFVEFAASATSTLHALIPSDGVGWNEVDVEGRALRIVTSPDDYGGAFAALGSLIHQHPIVSYVTRTGDGSPTTFSDHLGLRAYHRLELYRDVFGPAGVEDQLATVVQISPLVAGIAFNRARRSFTERDRALLAIVRPHLSAAHRNLSARIEARERLELLERGLAGRHIVPLTQSGCIAHDSSLLARWFGAMPVRLKPGIYEGDGARLIVRFVDGDPPVLLIDEERYAVDAGRARELGLTARETEIVALAARGLMNVEIATELFISKRTVAKHLQNVYEKLDVASREEAFAKLRG